MYTEIELSKGREARTLHSTRVDIGRVLDWTGHQIGSSINMPQFLRKAEHTSSFMKL